MPKPQIVHAQTVACPDGRKVRNLFYDDGSYRFRISDCPLVLEEAYLSGNAQLTSIIKLAPKQSPPATTTTELNDPDALLGELVMRYGNHERVAPIVPAIQKILGTRDLDG